MKKLACTSTTIQSSKNAPATRVPPLSGPCGQVLLLLAKLAFLWRRPSLSWRHSVGLFRVQRNRAAKSALTAPTVSGIIHLAGRHSRCSLGSVCSDTGTMQKPNAWLTAGSSWSPRHLLTSTALLLRSTMSRGRLILTEWRPSTVTKAVTSRVFLAKGMSNLYILVHSRLTLISFGWVNASYVYGLTLLSAHQRRALGALTDWDSYSKAMEDLGMM